MFVTTSGDSVIFHTMANAAAPLLLVHGKYDLTVCSSQWESSIVCTVQQVDKNLFSVKKLSLDIKSSNVLLLLYYLICIMTSTIWPAFITYKKSFLPHPFGLNWVHHAVISLITHCTVSTVYKVVETWLLQRLEIENIFNNVNYANLQLVTRPLFTAENIPRNSSSKQNFPANSSPKQNIRKSSLQQCLSL